MEPFKTYWHESNKCPNCNGPLFKYTDVSKSLLIVRCGRVRRALKERKLPNGYMKFEFVDTGEAPCQFLVSKKVRDPF